MHKLSVGILGVTGYVGQRFLTLLANHPDFEIRAVAASARSAGRTLGEVLKDRWKLAEPFPETYRDWIIADAQEWVEKGVEVDLVFCAVDLPKDQIRVLEEALAKHELLVVSNNSANRWTSDVPLMIPEVNGKHLEALSTQRERLGTKRGCIVCKPNCSIQAYVSALTPLLPYQPDKLMVCTYQAVSGAGKRLSDWPEMDANVIPYIGGEEEKSEQEPLKIWGEWNSSANRFELATKPLISAQCYRVPVQEGHLAAVSVSFAKKPSQETILEAWREASHQVKKLNLPSLPETWLNYSDALDRPQPRLDSARDGGMGIWIGRLREDPIFDYKFACLAHNTLRGAAGGAVLTAELLVRTLGLK